MATHDPRIGAARFLRAVSTLYQRHATGCLRLDRGLCGADLYFDRGQLALATSDRHRLRRWKRAVSKHFPDCQAGRCDCPIADRLTPVSAADEPWEAHCLFRALNEGFLDRRAARAILSDIVAELLFVTLSPGVTFRWEARRKLPEPAEATLNLQELKILSQDVASLQQHWQKLDLGYEYADRALVLQEIDRVPARLGASTLLNFKPLLNGKRTFWDVVVKMEGSVSGVLRILGHFLQQGAVEFRELPDLTWAACTLELPPPPPPLVLCIDDSPATCKTLERILTGNGYRCAAVRDPLQAIPAAIRHSPDLILLDLVMPVANGYEICAQLRRLDRLQNVPIVILTSRDGTVDRLRARMVRATDFLGKPVSPQKLLETLGRYLDSAPVAPTALSPTDSLPTLPPARSLS